ncbi:hypothetical protein EUZ85_08375 [Hahella sp. KA22]|uniref:hypothetical protein n=1 Tax=Hahella sp. KA22 TaxID=1628392 RepID=UPI000FDDF609|nr:hypothetical protein [Hahella sp. KA22]AZZ90727.1 hypothetical protein ENC22_05825 [Hahella sp. KA22]QAY54097.1 hypothetical protein EUZ85_08375 [Hahella sp. KA22]
MQDDVETYQVVTRGKLASGQELNQVQRNLKAQLRLNDAMTAKVFAGAPLKLKSNLTWRQAQGWRKKLHQLGLQTELALQLNPACLQAGLQAAPQEPDQEEQDDQILLFEAGKLTPHLVHFSESLTLSNESETAVARIVNHNAYWSPLALVLASTGLALTLQNHLLRVMTHYLQWGALASVLSIVFLLLAIVCLPRLLQPRMLQSIADARGAHRIYQQELPVFWVGAKKHRLIDAEQHDLGVIERKQQSATLTDAQGDLVYEWRQAVRVHESSKDALGKIQEKLVEDTALGPVAEYLGHAKKVLDFLKRKRAKSAASPSRDPQNAMAVLDQEGNLAALVYATPEPAAQIRKPDLSPQERLRLLAFCACLLRSPLV